MINIIPVDFDAWVTHTEERGSPSLVGRGIANHMFERTRGFESHSPRLIRVFIHYPFMALAENSSIGHRQDAASD